MLEKGYILVVTYNRLECLKKCINSILNQTYSNVEIIIIDDCSKDDTNKEFSNYHDKRVRYYLNDKNSGMGFNRQKGYNLSTGDFVIFADDDDYFIDFEYFKNTINIFESDNNISLICSHTLIHYEVENEYKFYRLNIPKKISSMEYLKKFQFKYRKPTSTFPLIIRKSTMEQANFKAMAMMNDSSIYLRALMIPGMVYLYNHIIGIYRVHGMNDTLNAKAEFTIENLEEKKYVYDYLLANNKFNRINKWYSKQIMITVKHFLNGKENNKNKIKMVFSWIRKNVEFITYIKAVLYLNKKILKGKKIIKNENK